jgi:ATP-binding cassette, subfamily B, bacterial
VTGRGARLPAVAGGRRGRQLAGLVATGVAQGGTGILTALLVGAAFSRLLGPAHPRPASGTAALVLGGLMAAAVLAAGLRALERILAERMGQAYVHAVRMRLFRHVTAAQPRQAAARSTGATVLRFTGDLSALRTWVSLGLARLAVGVPAVLAGVTGLVVVAPALGITVAAVVAAGAAAAWAQGPRIRRTVAEARRRRSRLAADVTEKVARVAVVQAFGQERRERRRIARHSQLLAAAMIDRAAASGALLAITELTVAAATAGVIAAAVYTGASPGVVATGLTLVGFLVPPLRDLGRVQEYGHNAHVAREKLTEVLARPVVPVPAPAGARALGAGPGALDLCDVTLGTRLRGVTGRVEAGQVVAVVGPNGAGKSTLLDVVARLVVPDSGQVLLDGEDLATVRPGQLRAAIGIVGADLPLLRGTVRRNLTYRCPGASDLDLARVVDMTDLQSLLDELPDGLRTRLGEGGAGLSSGQRQRLALARALLGNPRLLLLDEPDANLDPTTARVVDRVVADFPGTVLMVTHRPERLLRADVAWRLESGRLVSVASAAEAFVAEGRRGAHGNQPTGRARVT